jgi:hypothetical protein
VASFGWVGVDEEELVVDEPFECGLCLAAAGVDAKTTVARMITTATTTTAVPVAEAMR